MAEGTQQPVIFLGEGTKRTRGRDAQRINIMVAKAVAHAIKSTLGPKGMDKMIVDELGDITISNDGRTILEEMSIEHPIGKMMVEVAKTQDDEVGDGTTTATVIAGTLLEKAEKMLDDEIHPSIIIKGYRLASVKAKEFYAETGERIEIGDKQLLRDIALTSMTGKAAEGAEKLSDLVVDAIIQVAEDRKIEYDGKTAEKLGSAELDKRGRPEFIKTKVDIEDVKVEKKVGAALTDSELVKGIVIDKEIVHSNMPKKLQNAKIALVDAAFEIKETETDAKIQITSPDQLQAFLDQEEGMLKKMV